MPVFKTTTLLSDLQEQTESFLQLAISQWQMLPPHELSTKPAPDSWSAAQCLEHLNSYGRYYLPAISQAIESATQKQHTSKETFTTGMLGNYFTTLMKPTEGKKLKKMSAPQQHFPAENPDTDKVLAEFIDQQELLIDLLEKARAIDLERAKVAISIAKFIRLKLGDVFSFVVAHNHRHIVQAQKAMTATTRRNTTVLL